MLTSRSDNTKSATTNKYIQFSLVLGKIDADDYITIFCVTPADRRKVKSFKIQSRNVQ